MSRPNHVLTSLLAAGAFVVAANAASASDRIVDATGSTGDYTTIPQAMSDAVPGDRILVMPGSYAGFDFTVGVSVLGLGADASEVVIGEVYFHVGDPAVGYEAVLQNVTLHSDDPTVTLLLHGNENGPGSLTLDGVRVDGGGVYLRGGDDGFYVHISNSDVRPQQGYGFSGEACYVGGSGSFVELRNSRVIGWDASPDFLLPAGIGLRLFGGSHVRIVGCEIRGGAGVASSDPSLAAGGDAITYGLTGDTDLLLEGGTIVQGGDGIGAAGGDGVSIDGTIRVGNAQVHGGAGTPPGADFGLDAPTWLSTDLALAIEPALQFADGATFVTSGDHVKISVHPGYASLIVLAFAVDMPASDLFFPLSPSAGFVFVPADAIEDDVPSDPNLAAQGIMLYSQAFIVDPATHKLALTNSAALRVDLQ